MAKAGAELELAATKFGNQPAQPNESKVGSDRTEQHAEHFSSIESRIDELVRAVSDLRQHFQVLKDSLQERGPTQPPQS